MPQLTTINQATSPEGVAGRQRFRWLETVLRPWRRSDSRSLNAEGQSLMDGRVKRALDPAILAKFGLTPLLARRVVEGFLSGLHQSPFRGFSVEFADHREYVPGDDLKFLDWRLYARTDHYYVKRSEEETNVRCFLLLDRSGSMQYGSGRLTKWNYASFLVGCLAYLMLKQQDAAGLALFGAGPGVMVPPRCRRRHLHQIMQVVLQNPPSGETDLTQSLNQIVRRLKRRSMIVVVSDLIDDPEATVKAIRMLRSRRHDVIVFHVQDPAEIEFNFQGAAVFRDIETGQEMEVDPVSMRSLYLEHWEELQTFYRTELREAGVDYEPLDIREPYDQALMAYLRRRADLRG